MDLTHQASIRGEYNSREKAAQVYVIKSQRRDALLRKARGGVTVELGRKCRW